MTSTKRRKNASRAESRYPRQRRALRYKMEKNNKSVCKEMNDEKIKKEKKKKK